MVSFMALSLRAPPPHFPFMREMRASCNHEGCERNVAGEGECVGKVRVEGRGRGR